jgi:hypothetical protein
MSKIFAAICTLTIVQSSLAFAETCEEYREKQDVNIQRCIEKSGGWGSFACRLKYAIVCEGDNKDPTGGLIARTESVGPNSDVSEKNVVQSTTKPKYLPPPSDTRPTRDCSERGSCTSNAQ